MNPVLALIIANIIWGAASPIFKLSLENIPPFTLGFIRFFFAGLIFLPFGFMKWQSISWRQLGTILVGAFFATTVNIGFYFLALPKTASINAPVIGSSQPLFLYILAIILLKEKPHKRVLWGILIAFTGVLIIIFSPLLLDGEISLSSKETAMIGNLYLLIATSGALLNALIFKNILKVVNHIQVTTITFFSAALTFFFLMLPEQTGWTFNQLDQRGWLGIIFGVFFSSAVAYSLFNYGMSKIDAQEVGIFSYIDPIIAVLLAIPLLNEYPTIFFFVGSVLVFGGIIIAEGRIHWHPIHLLKKQKVLQNTKS